MMLKDFLQHQLVNTDGYLRSDTAKAVHAYLRTLLKNKGFLKTLTKNVRQVIKKDYCRRCQNTSQC